MRHKISGLISLFTILFSFLLSGINANASVKADGWKLYPSFDKSVIKIMDSEKYCYFLVHSQYYQNNAEGNNSKPYPIIFRKDKSNPSSDIIVLYDAVDANGTIVNTAQYNPNGKNLLVVYDDFSIDIVNDDNSVENLSELKNYSFPAKKVNSITFDSSGNYGYIATNFGYAKVNMKSNQISEIKNLNQDIMFIAAVGDKLIAQTADGVYEINTSKSAASFSDFTPIKVNVNNASANIVKDGTIVTPYAVLPLSDDTFGLIAKRSSGTGHSINLLKRNGDNWDYTLLKDDALRVQASTEIINNQWEANLIPNREGYYIFSNNFAYQLTPNGIEVKNKSANGTLASGSWDFDTFWFYKTREGFIARNGFGKDSSVTWSDVTTVQNPVCAPAFISNRISYSPKYGFIFANEGVSWHNTNYNTKVPALLTGIKDGIITNYSPAYNKTSFIENNPTINDNFQSKYADEYPISRPAGLSIDPSHPNLIYTGSPTHGIARFNFDDLKAPILHLSRPNDQDASWPGFIGMAPIHSFSANCSFSSPSFDNDGNLFASYWNYNGENNTKFQIWCLSHDQKEQSLNSNLNRELFIDWNRVNVGSIGNVGWHHTLLALKHSNNRNILITTPSAWYSDIIIYDHKGSLYDISDDKVTITNDFINSSGKDIHPYSLYKLYEDPLTGYVWILYPEGCFFFDPNDILNGSHLINYCNITDNSGQTEQFLSNIEVFDIIRDDNDRMWFAANNGVWCLNPELNKVIEHYTTNNSQLPSNFVYAICWNPETQSLLMSTAKGLAEVVPSEAGSSTEENRFRIYPKTISPNWSGMISISGVENESLNLADKSGNIITSLPNSSNGKIYWSGMKDNKERIESGRYTIVGANSGNEYGKIIILK